MKKIILASLVVAQILSTHPAQACTVFKDPLSTQAGLAQNFDWYEKFADMKGVLVMNPAGYKKVGEMAGAAVEKAQWTAKWRSITFSNVGAEFPAAGINEKGLSMAVLEFREGVYPPVSDSRPGVGGAQFVQYQLDTATTVDEVIASDKVVRPYSGLFKLHYFVCESGGACAVLQYVDGKLNVYRGDSLPFATITNSAYPASVDAARSCTRESCEIANNSLWRFAQATLQRSEMSKEKSFAEQAAPILNYVAQKKGSITRFQNIFDAQAGVIFARHAEAAKFSRLAIDFAKGSDCHQPRWVIPLQKDSAADLKDSWIELTPELQERLNLDAGIPEKVVELYGKYPFEGIHCE